MVSEVKIITKRGDKVKNFIEGLSSIVFFCESKFFIQRRKRHTKLQTIKISINKSHDEHKIIKIIAKNMIKPVRNLAY